MQTKVQQWGNSLAVRIPKALAMGAGLHKGADISISHQDGTITIKPTATYSLEAMLAQIDDSNMHEALDTGEPIGLEEM